MKQLKILLVNERGCFDKGIITLAKVLSLGHRVTVVAPLRKQERVAGSITASNPLRTDRYRALNRAAIFSVDGTPCDCIELALDGKLLSGRPDVIISGIDPHHNRGETMLSSGVAGAAIRGTINGVKSISISADITNRFDEKEYIPVAKFISSNLKNLMEKIQPETTLNINFPRGFSARRIKWTHLTLGMVDCTYTQETSPLGRTFYWMNNPSQNYPLHVLEQEGDIYWLKKGYITITPLKYNLTEFASLDLLKKSGITI